MSGSPPACIPARPPHGTKQQAYARCLCTLRPCPFQGPACTPGGSPSMPDARTCRDRPAAHEHQWVTRRAAGRALDASRAAGVKHHAGGMVLQACATTSMNWQMGHTGSSWAEVDAEGAASVPGLWPGTAFAAAAAPPVPCCGSREPLSPCCAMTSSLHAAVWGTRHPSPFCAGPQGNARRSTDISTFQLSFAFLQGPAWQGTGRSWQAASCVGQRPLPTCAC